ncbi:unnamed protein product [Parajaminaea phylloscopi]
MRSHSSKQSRTAASSAPSPSVRAGSKFGEGGIGTDAQRFRESGTSGAPTAASAQGGADKSAASQSSGLPAHSSRRPSVRQPHVESNWRRTPSQFSASGNTQHRIRPPATQQLQPVTPLPLQYGPNATQARAQPVQHANVTPSYAPHLHYSAQSVSPALPQSQHAGPDGASPFPPEVPTLSSVDEPSYHHLAPSVSATNATFSGQPTHSDAALGGPPGFYVYTPYSSYGNYYMAQAAVSVAQPPQYLSHGFYPYSAVPAVTYCEPGTLQPYYAPSHMWTPLPTATMHQHVPQAVGEGRGIVTPSTPSTRPSSTATPLAKPSPSSTRYTPETSAVSPASSGLRSTPQPESLPTLSASMAAASLQDVSRRESSREEPPRLDASTVSVATQAQPVLRSDYVMWVGNIPSNATHPELRQFFSRIPSEDLPEGPEAQSDGILSIFIISRSNCAFVNYTSQTHLDAALAYFHNQVLRPDDPRAAKLICRPRKKEDELQAGVAGQRGKGHHVAFLKEAQRRLREDQGSRPETEAIQMPDGVVETSREPTYGSDQLRDRSGLATQPGAFSLAPASTLGMAVVPKDVVCASMSSVTTPSADSATTSSADISYTSTNSDLLRHRAFHRRYFIIKSRSVEELERSVATARWSTQTHNEAVLDQAYRLSEQVTLIFSANSSGAFFGYAQMAGPISPRRNAGTTLAPQQGAEEGKEAASVSHIVNPSSQLDSLDPSEAFKAGQASEVISSPLQLTPVDEVPPPIPTQESAQEASTPHNRHDRASSELSGAAVEAADGPRPHNSTPNTSLVTADGIKRRDMARTMSPTESPSSDPPGSALPSSANSGGFAPQGSTDHASAYQLGPGDSVTGDSRAASQLATRAIIHNLRIEQRESQRKAEQLEHQLLVHEQMASAGTARVRSALESEPSAPVVDISTPTPTATEGHIQDEDPQSNPFKVDWRQTRPLPFSAVKHLRNPWNENKSLRVARDGTEVAIDTGAELISLWERYLRDQAPDE